MSPGATDLAHLIQITYEYCVLQKLSREYTRGFMLYGNSMLTDDAVQIKINKEFVRKYTLQMLFC